MKSTQVFVVAAVVIAVSVIGEIEGRPQNILDDYSEVDGFLFKGKVDRTSYTTTQRNFRTPMTLPTSNFRPTFRPTSVTSTSLRTTTNAEVDQCVQDCRLRVTSEYNPVCGTDRVVYNNPGLLACANGCGRNVRQAYLGPCTTNVRG